MNESTLSATDNNEELDFADIAEAVATGDTAALDRFMGNEVKEEEETEATPAGDAETEEQGEEPQEIVEGNTDEAATPAASTAADTEVNETEQLKQEIHRLKSDAGRVPYLQRRMQELERELRATKARTVTATTSGDQSPAALPDKVKQRIEALREIDPDLADTLEAMHTSLAQEARGAKAAVETLVQHDEEAAERQFFEEQRTLLLRDVPQADAIFATPEWKQWKENLTPGRRALTESGYAEEMVQAIYAFAADMKRLHGNTAPASTSVVHSEGGDPNTTSTATQPVNNIVQESRARKVQVAAEIKSPAAKASVAFDADAAFKEMYAKALKDMGVK